MSHWEQLAVPAIDCTGCKQTILRTLGNFDGVTRVTANHATGTVELLVDDDVSLADLEAALRRIGYDQREPGIHVHGDGEEALDTEG
jgi:copper chaperone CopZ